MFPKANHRRINLSTFNIPMSNTIYRRRHALLPISKRSDDTGQSDESISGAAYFYHQNSHSHDGTNI